ncbi:hypothetical protein AQUCO_00300790v1 [Aquilegia coerulea]|uniref:Uncharacterized protein n=1 Tax=Aquilegia coerulea TaxID=218851 RepID=A0A2G5F0L0_AQUCA|nr:hypothetical protein AQUCO_00300790v1 [Aquilegia coerulea]
MGTVVSKAANGIGAVLGNAFVAPIKTVFGGNCDAQMGNHHVEIGNLVKLIVRFNIAFGPVTMLRVRVIIKGTWDITCFIEHLCVANIVKLMMVFILTYITLMFLYLLFKLGLVQCIVRSLCKMGWAACETYWLAMGDITCFLWYKLKNTKRVHRRRRHRFKDVEEGYSSSLDDDNYLDYYNNASVIRRQRSYRNRRMDRLQRSHYPTSHGSKERYRSHSHHHEVDQLKSRGLSVRLKGGSGRLRNTRQLQVKRIGSFKLKKRRKIKR